MVRKVEDIDAQLEACWQDMVSAPEQTASKLKTILSSMPQSDSRYGQVLFYLGCCLTYTGDNVEAIAYTRMAQRFAADANDMDLLQRVLNVLGMAQKSIGEFGKAIENLERSYELADQLGSQRGKIVAQLNAIELYYDVDDLEAYEQTLTEVLNSGFCFSEPELQTGVLFLQGRLALIHYDFVAAHNALHEAYDLANQIHFADLRIAILIEIGRMLRLSGKLDEAKKTLKQVIADPELHLQGVEGLVAYIELTKTLFSLGETQDAHLTLLDAEAILDTHLDDNLLFRYQVYELMAHTWASRKQYFKAYDYIQRASTVKNALTDKQAKQTIEIRKQKQQKETEQLRRASAERENALLKKSQQQLRVLNSFAIELASTLEVEALGEKLYALMHQYFDAHYVSLSINDPEKKRVVFRSVIDDGHHIPLHFIGYDNTKSRTIQAIFNKKPLVTGPSEDSIQIGTAGKMPNSQLFLPLQQEGEVVGVLSIQSSMMNRFDGEDLELILAVSSFITVALSNALSHEEVKQLNQALVKEKALIEQAQSQIEFLANHDTLTELPNRRALEQHLKKMISAETPRQFSLVYIDLDGFKPVNDVHGHAKGDDVLKIIANRLRHLLRVSDFAARIGGDEFVLVIESVTDRPSITKLICRVLDSIEKDISINSIIISISASIGVVEYTNPNMTQDDLMHFADQAMYDVKRSGKGGVKFYFHD